MQNAFLRFDPLILIVTSLAGRMVIAAALPALVVVILTFVFGRFFCGFICPLGTIIDISDSARNRTCGKKCAGKKDEIHQTYQYRSVKYFTLLFLLVAAAIGASFIQYLDPFIILERTLTLSLHPIASYLTNTIFYTTGPIYTENIFALLGLGIILLLGWFGTRYWCGNLCPLGGLLALTSKISLFRFSIKDNCERCGFCDKICPTRAIDSERVHIDKGECISCLRCLYECPHKTINYHLRPDAQPVNLPRRHFVRTVIAGAVLAPVARVLLYQRLSDRLIRPPGAIPEADFMNLCLRCGKCMKICPTNGLQPCVFETGVNGLWTPRLIPRIGGCEKNCNLCGQICPTGAIRKLELEEKTYARIGTAVIDRSRCIAWEQDKVCLICDEACPYNAISSLNETILNKTMPRPFVDEDICTGCGLCEARCPIDGASAIQIFSMNQERRKTGSYMSPEKIRLRSQKKYIDDLPSGFIK